MTDLNKRIDEPCPVVWTSENQHLFVGMEKGDYFTISSEYKKRTFWQWITRQPKQLKIYEAK